MMNFDLTNIGVKHLITHYIGNRLRDEKLKLSETETDVKEDSSEILVRYFLSGFNFNEVYNFTHSVSLDMNEVYRLCSKLFSRNKNFITNSQHIATLLYQYSMHPKIKEGDLNIVYFNNILIGDSKVDAIGIFKSENSTAFLKMKGSKGQYHINHDFGYDSKEIDRGCLVLNTDEEIGYKIVLSDAIKKREDAQYWKDEFLKVRPVSDSYYFTNNLLSVAKTFITQELPHSFEVSKTDQIDYLNKSVEYFKENETFDIKKFQQKVFEDADIIKSFQKFGSGYLSEHNIDIAEKFEISSQAVKKQARVFKSVLKLDKNFHIYVHGNTELIEKGFDSNKGKHYYKIYFDSEA